MDSKCEISVKSRVYVCYAGLISIILYVYYMFMPPSTWMTWPEM